MNENAGTILIVDDEREILESLSLIFSSRGFKVHTAPTGIDALKLFAKNTIPVVICDNSLPDTQGLELLKSFREILPEVQVIMVTGKGTIDIAVSAMKAGMFDFITKPVDPEHLIQLAIRANQLYSALAQNKVLMREVQLLSSDELIGNHQSIGKLMRLISTVAPTDSTVLIEGESGTGKELVARMIHKKSDRARGHFVAVDCGAIPEGLVESELFGHEKGAFTGASGQKQGRFERANGGSLFLDEITNLPLQSQVKLLRALQEKVIERVGGQKNVPINIRLIAATNMSLHEAMVNKLFREDLYYRLNIIKIKIPPLRERKSDIYSLAMHFIEKHKERIKSPVQEISKEALKTLMEYSWPGNVRELENAIEHALIMAASSEIMAYDLPSFAESGASGSTLEEAERQMLLNAIKGCEGNKYKAAKVLGIPRSSLYSKLKKYGIS